MQRYLFIAAFFAVSFAHAQNPYITHVWEYCPAPGQFVNSMPEYEEGDDANDLRMKAKEAIADNNRGMISLGGWGGYVVFGFDHMIVNVPDANDLLVLGNAFTGSAEPGIVMVSYDANANGKPDDEWYELAGSEYTNPQTIHDYSVTYRRAQEGKNYPQWIEEDSVTFTGCRLPDNYEDLSGVGTYYVLYAYPFGYHNSISNGQSKQTAHPRTCPVSISSRSIPPFTSNADGSVRHPRRSWEQKTSTPMPHKTWSKYQAGNTKLQNCSETANSIFFVITNYIP